MHRWTARKSGKAEAQMAESVDALVSNTSRFTPVPVRPRLWVQKTLVEQLLRGFLLFKTSKMVTFGHHFKNGGHFSTHSPNSVVGEQVLTTSGDERWDWLRYACRSHPLAAGALPKFESVLDTTFSLYMVVGEQVLTTIYNEKSLAMQGFQTSGGRWGCCSLLKILTTSIYRPFQPLFFTIWSHIGLRKIVPYFCKYNDSSWLSKLLMIVDVAFYHQKPYN